MNASVRKILGTAAIVSAALYACEKTQTSRRDPGASTPPGGPTGTQTIQLRMPAYSAVGSAAAAEIQRYVGYYTLQVNSPVAACAHLVRPTLAPQTWVENQMIPVQVDPGCGMTVALELGYMVQGQFAPMYRTQGPIALTFVGNAMTASTLILNRTPVQAAAPTTAPSVQVAVVSSALDQNPSNPSLNNNNNSNTTTSYATAVQPIFAEKCATCHRPGGSMSRLDLSTFSAVSSVGFQRVMGSVTRGAMPPPSARPLTATDRSTLATWQSGNFAP